MIRGSLHYLTFFVTFSSSGGKNKRDVKNKRYAGILWFVICVDDDGG
jgi:hypothetical protein